MSRFSIYSLFAAAIAFAGLSFGQGQQTTTPAPSTSPTEGTSADRTPPGKTPTRPVTAAEQAQTQTQPSTSQTEGTAADRTPPAKTTPMKSTDREFAELDENHDRRLSKSEAAGDPALSAVFDAVDTNHDGYITQREYSAYVKGRSGKQRPSEQQPDPER